MSLSSAVMFITGKISTVYNIWVRWERQLVHNSAVTGSTYTHPFFAYTLLLLGMQRNRKRGEWRKDDGDVVIGMRDEGEVVPLIHIQHQLNCCV